MTDKQKAKLHKLVNESTYARISILYNSYIVSVEDMQRIAKLKSEKLNEVLKTDSLC